MNENKIKAMGAFKVLVAAIDAIPASSLADMNPHPEVWNTHNTVVSQAKAGLMADFAITKDEWDQFFADWPRFS